MKLSLRDLIKTREEKRILAFHRKYLTPMDQSSPDDIFIAGYPKSGNTWFQDLVAGLVFGILPDKADPGLVLDLVPDVHAKTYYIRYRTPTFFKTHFKPEARYRNVVYLLRDGRDAMVSYWHHVQALRHGPVDFLSMIRTGENTFPCKWHEHVESWMANPYHARMMIIRYEDLLSEPVRELERFCIFAGVQADVSDIQRTSERASFAKMQERERNKGVGFAETAWPKDRIFRRRGVAGSFRDEMPDEILKAFLLEAGDTLKKQGYPV